MFKLYHNNKKIIIAFFLNIGDLFKDLYAKIE